MTFKHFVSYITHCCWCSVKFNIQQHCTVHVADRRAADCYTERRWPSRGSSLCCKGHRAKTFVSPSKLLRLQQQRHLNVCYSPALNWTLNSTALCDHVQSESVQSLTRSSSDAEIAWHATCWTQYWDLELTRSNCDFGYFRLLYMPADGTIWFIESVHY